jgi:universal stress protein E
LLTEINARRRGKRQTVHFYLLLENPMKKILIATDLSDRSDRALQRAAMLAHEFVADLKILHVVDESLLEGITLQHEAAAKSAIAAQVAALPLAKSISVSQQVVRGFDYCDISAIGATSEADLIVLGTHRHKARELFQGTTAERVVRYGTVPVLVVKEVPRAAYRRVLVAADLSEHSLAAVALAAKIAPKADVYLLYAAYRPVTALLGRDKQSQLISDERARILVEIEKVTQRIVSELGASAPRFEILIKEGDVRRVIREQVAALEPDLLAVGTHGRTGLAHAIIGSIAEDLLADAPVDVLAVKAR